MIGRPTPLDTPGEVQVGDGHATGLIALLQSRACHVPTGLPWPVYAPVYALLHIYKDLEHNAPYYSTNGMRNGAAAVLYVQFHVRHLMIRS